MTKEKEIAEAIIKKHLTIVAEENMSSDEILLYTAKNCSRSEVQAIIDNIELYVTYLQLQYKDFEFSTLEFWQGVLEEIK